MENIQKKNREFNATFKVQTPPTLNIFSYTINICGKLKEDSELPEIDQCPKGTWGCRKVTNFKEEKPRVVEVGSFAGGSSSSGAEEPTIIHKEKSEGSEGGYFWKMEGQKLNNEVLSAEISLRCNDTHTDTEYGLSKVIFKDNHFTAELYTKEFCELYKKPEGDKPGEKEPEKKKPEDGDKKKKESWGFFSTVLFLTFSGTCMTWSPDQAAVATTQSRRFVGFRCFNQSLWF
ncbi:Autophagy-related protein 27 [Zancudomyces culisetae]|uniref:Autophagy-related protein 27 n=1 Tax=Zancudomyces culisetae TaxID=1213189 RepID=A0A1R1PUK8_ZANCU|nr:Autophagy-related protein 27 [Zancudomyces culisetae]|eukprot:OMH84658.1 Autophagy-related protein 27 [Zancudomyces culisetae]